MARTDKSAGRNKNGSAQVEAAWLEATDSRDNTASGRLCSGAPHLWVTASPENLDYSGYESNKVAIITFRSLLSRFLPDLNSLLITIGPVLAMAISVKAPVHSKVAIGRCRREN
jgi:hypothetical protein